MEGPPTLPPAVPRPVEPKFHFLDINTANLSGLGPHITIDNKLAIFKVAEIGSDLAGFFVSFYYGTFQTSNQNQRNSFTGTGASNGIDVTDTEYKNALVKLQKNLTTGVNTLR